MYIQYLLAQLSAVNIATKKVLIILRSFIDSFATIQWTDTNMTNQDVLSTLLPGTRRVFKPQTPIIYQGEVPRHGYYIRSGIVKAYTLQSNGDEQVVGFFGPGDLFPLPWLFGTISTSIYYHEAIEPCNLISVTRQDVQSIILKNSAAKDQLLHKLVRDQAAYLMRITALEQSRAVEKIMFTLYYLMYQFGVETSTENLYLIETKLTHATIASLVGLTRETTATEINKLKKKGVLSYSKKLYTIDKSKLERAIGEDGFTELLSS